MFDPTRRRFLFGLAAVPLMVPAVKHFVMPAFELAPLKEMLRIARVGLPEPVWRKFHEGVSSNHPILGYSEVQRSVDGGLTWEPCSLVPSGYPS